MIHKWKTFLHYLSMDILIIEKRKKLMKDHFEYILLYIILDDNKKHNE